MPHNQRRSNFIVSVSDGNSYKQASPALCSDGLVCFYNFAAGDNSPASLRIELSDKVASDDGTCASDFNDKVSCINST
ncbi:MAG: hypothetical protein V4495_26170, partial [Pseudomonadota bacterium]